MVDVGYCKLDQAKEVRKGETLNETALTDYLKKKLGESEEELTVKQFPSGFSNLTYLINYNQILFYLYAYSKLVLYEYGKILK